MEDWKTIEGFHDLYQVSSLGNIRRKISDDKFRAVKCSLDGRGYVQFDMTYKGERKHMVVHRCVGKAFIENNDNLAVVNHKDGNKENNCIDNLEWTSLADNVRHAHQTGLMNNRKTVNAYNPDGKLHYVFHGIHMATHAGFDLKEVRSYLYGKRRSKPNGYHFEYADPCGNKSETYIE